MEKLFSLLSVFIKSRGNRLDGVNVAELSQDEKEKIERMVSRLEEPIKRIIVQLRTRIDTGEYKVVIGQDASGRLPALILQVIFFFYL